MGNRQYWLFGVPAVIFIFGLLMAFYIKEGRVQDNNTLILKTTQTKLSSLSTEITEAVRRYEYGLRGLKAAVDAVGFDKFNYQAQLSYFKGRDYPKEFPGARGFGLIKKVEQKNLAGFLASASEDRGTPFQLTQLSEPKDPLFIIQYLEPEVSNAKAIGLDIGSESARRLSALQSATTGSTQLTAPITLVQATDKQKHGFLLLHAVMAKLSETTTSRLQGWVYAPLLINEIIDSVVSKNDDFQIEIADTTISKKIDFYKSTPENDAVINEFKVSTVAEVFGRHWQINLTPTQKFIDELAIADADFAFWQLVVLSLLCAVLSFGLVHYSHRRLSDIKTSNTLAAVVDSTSDGIVSVDSYFAIKSWNQAAELLFEFNPQHSLGKPLANWFAASMAPDKLMQLLKQVAQGKIIKQYPITYKTDGVNEVRHLALNISPIFVNKTFSGATLVFFDSTAIIQLQNQLIQTNKELEHRVEDFQNYLSMQLLFEERIVNQAHLAMIFCDPEGVISRLSPLASTLLGYGSAKLEGRNVRELLLNTPDSDGAADISMHLLKQSETRKHKAVDALFRHQSGKHISAHLSVIPLSSGTQNRGYIWILDDLTEKKDMQRHIQLIQSAVENAQDVMLWLNPDGEIFYSNPYATLALNIKPSRLIGMNIRDILLLEHMEDWATVLGHIIQGGLHTFEAKLKKTNNTFTPKLVSGCAIELDGQYYVYLAAKNIAERLEKEKKIELALEKADEGSAAKSAFISNMSNEFRTPLHAINGYLQLIGHSSTEGRKHGYVASAKTEVAKLNQVLDDILTVSDFYNAASELHEEDFELDALLADVGGQLYRMVGEKAVEVYFDVAADLPFFFHADSHKLTRILLHIAGNAIKFTHRGEVTVRLSHQQLDDNEIQLYVSVTDTGVGIEPDQLQNIFEMFSQGDSSASRKFKGLGLGLTIAHHYISLMKGSIQLKSEPGLGSEFSFDIRVKTAQRLIIPARFQQAETPIHVLVVDDNTTSLQILRETITPLHWNVTTTSSAADALTLLQSALNHQEPYDLVLIDWLMPEMDGLELAEMIRKLVPVNQVPVLIMVTGRNSDVLAAHYEKRPELLNGFLTKPVTRSQIVDAFFDAVAAVRHNVFRSVASPEAQLLKDIRILVVEDNPTNQYIAEELLALHGAIVTVAAGGMEALAVLENSLVSFDLVLMDIQMPGMDGYEITKHIKNKDSFKDLPVIAVTASVMFSDQKKCLEAGMVGHIAKPFELTDLVDKILEVRSEANQSVHSATLAVENSNEFDDRVFEFCLRHHIDIRSAMARFNHMTKIYTQSLDLLITDLNNYKAQLSEGANSTKDLKLLFHTLKSTSAALGFSDLSKVATALEAALEQNEHEASKLDTDYADLIQQMETTTQLAEQLSQLMPGSQAVVGRRPGADFLPAYNRLKTELSSFNMQALQSIEAIAAELQFLSPEGFDKLNEAMSALKFKDAYEMLKQFDELIEKKLDAK
ncbi:MAG TPA: response regulator [Rheinheimera sp.]|uniref:response regulator n=1 Tax=Rheinheimera sp. TaxID=1869214 RepID=UPI002B4701A9|nr:response regulator [Rheinheimera sp.]HJS14354.1 response regulator [Rheinheimera sp.]